MKRLTFLMSCIAILVALYLSIKFHTLDSTDKLAELPPVEEQK